MVYSLTWLSQVLGAAHLKVAPTSGWEERGCRPGADGDMGQIGGVLCHHTATTAPGNMPSLATLIAGRSDVPGPLAQLGLGRDGTFYLVAAGRCNHAGAGEGRFQNISGNGVFIGIEAENPLPYTATWPDVQMDAYVRGVAAILTHIGKTADMCIAHKEYAPSRKPVDPDFDMDYFRSKVTATMRGTAAPRPLIPTHDQGGHPTLRRGDRGGEVSECQRALGITVDGIFGSGTEAAVREFQRKAGLVPDGIIGPKTRERLNALPHDDSRPDRAAPQPGASQGPALPLQMGPGFRRGATNTFTAR